MDASSEMDSERTLDLGEDDFESNFNLSSDSVVREFGPTESASSLVSAPKTPQKIKSGWTKRPSSTPKKPKCGTVRPVLRCSVCSRKIMTQDGLRKHELNHKFEGI